MLSSSSFPYDTFSPQSRRWVGHARWENHPSGSVQAKREIRREAAITEPGDLHHRSNSFILIGCIYSARFGFLVHADNAHGRR